MDPVSRLLCIVSLALLVAGVIGCDCLYRCDGYVLEASEAGFTVFDQLPDPRQQSESVHPVSGAMVRLMVLSGGIVREFHPKGEPFFTDDRGRFSLSYFYNEPFGPTWHSILIEKEGFESLSVPAAELRIDRKGYRYLIVMLSRKR